MHSCKPTPTGLVHAQLFPKADRACLYMHSCLPTRQGLVDARQRCHDGEEVQGGPAHPHHEAQHGHLQGVRPGQRLQPASAPLDAVQAGAGCTGSPSLAAARFVADWAKEGAPGTEGTRRIKLIDG